MKKDLLQNIARDFVALGSPIFLVLVIVRLFILPSYEIILSLILGSAIFMVPFIFLRQNIYSGIGFITMFFLIQNYNNFLFGVFAIAAYLCLIGSLFYLKKDWKKILLGVLIGGLSAWISYYFAPKVFNLF